MGPVVRKFPSRAGLANIAAKRTSLSLTAPNINHLVRVYLLDGSSKVLQMTAASVVGDVLAQLKHNMDLADISTCALFRVVDGQGARRMELNENMKEAMKDIHNVEQDAPLAGSHSPGHAEGELPAVRILFRTWIFAKCGVFERDVFQDLERHKAHNSALWLAYMEATFMCMTGRYYLSDDEAVMLGCLRMQADSGDFQPEVHNLDMVKLRVCTRFPKPISTQMRALMSPTLRDNGMADALAERIMFLYARIAGKHKAEAQIEYLQCLRTWCPFYGASFFTVQCQYDDGASEHEPPVSTMNVAIGPLAIFLITQTEPLIILRHAYKRIVKWIAYKDKHIFCYWVVKQGTSLRDVDDAQQKEKSAAEAAGRVYKPETDFDATAYCDCIYLVTPSCGELEYLVRSYVALLKSDTLPKLRGAGSELSPPEPSEVLLGALADKLGVRLGEIGGDDGEENESSIGGPLAKIAEKPLARTPPPPPPQPARRKSRFGGLFAALGGGSWGGEDSPETPKIAEKYSSNPNVTGGSGIGSDSGSDDDKPGSGFGDDCAGVSSKTNLFRNVYPSPYRRASLKAKPGGAYDDDDENIIPQSIQFAASMSELQRLATERFSDDEAGGDGEGESDEDSDEGSGSGDSASGAGSGSAKSDGSKRRVSVKLTKESTFSKVKGILFGNKSPSLDKTVGGGTEVDEDGDSSGDDEFESDSD